MNEMQNNTLEHIKFQASEYACSLFENGRISKLELVETDYFVSAVFEIAPENDDIQLFPYPSSHLFIYKDGSVTYPVHIDHEMVQEDYIDFKIAIESQNPRNKNIVKDVFQSE
jgi:hypothetical protein